MNILEAIQDLYPLTSSGKYKAEFEDEKEARKFSLGIRSMVKEMGIEHKHCYRVVEQRNSNVYIDLEFAEKILAEVEEEVYQTSF